MANMLTAFEFIPADPDAFQIVRLLCRGVPVLTLCFRTWVGVDLSASPIDCGQREDLVVEGEGIAHPYWNDDRPVWAATFNPHAEAERIAVIRAAVQREVNRALLLQ